MHLENCIEKSEVKFAEKRNKEKNAEVMETLDLLQFQRINRKENMQISEQRCKLIKMTYSKQSKIKLIRAQGECLGTKSRRRTW
jgi:hypothetical protein